MPTQRNRRLVQLRADRAVLVAQRDHLRQQIAIHGGPDLAPFKVVHELDATEASLSELDARLDALQAAASSGDTPYVGLHSFAEYDADRFYGREELVDHLVGRVEGRSFLAVVGPSGSGKSSVVLAGLLPELREGRLAGSRAWDYLVMRPLDRPMAELEAALRTLGLAGNFPDLREMLARQEDALVVVGETLRRNRAGYRLLLVVDQFEELWALAPAEGEAREDFHARQRQPFIRLLQAAASATDSPVLVAITMRADYQHRTTEYPRFAELIDGSIVRVRPMSKEELQRAITEPARQVGGRFESGLVEELVEQVHGHNGALPALEFTLEKLWEARNTQNEMTWATYRQLDGVYGALASRADVIVDTKYDSEDKVRALRQILTRLVLPGMDTANARRPVPLNELVPAKKDVDYVQGILKPLIDERLLSTHWDETVQGDVVELSHEALIDNWQRLNNWTREDRQMLLIQQQLDSAAREWEAARRSHSKLLTGLLLDNAMLMANRRWQSLNQQERSYFVRSVLHEQRDIHYWLERWDNDAEALAVAAEYLNSPDEEDRLRGLAIMRWLGGAERAQDVDGELLRIVLEDPAREVCDRAAEVLGERGRLDLLSDTLQVADMTREEQSRLIAVLGHLRNLPAYGERILDMLHGSFRRRLSRTAAYRLLIDTQAILAIAFAIAYGVTFIYRSIFYAARDLYQLALNEVAGNTQITGITQDILASIGDSYVPLSAVTIGLFFFIGIFALIRLSIDRKSFQIRHGLRIAFATALITDSIQLIPLLAGRVSNLENYNSLPLPANTPGWTVALLETFRYFLGTFLIVAALSFLFLGWRARAISQRRLLAFSGLASLASILWYDWISGRVLDFITAGDSIVSSTSPASLAGTILGYFQGTLVNLPFYFIAATLSIYVCLHFTLAILKRIFADSHPEFDLLDDVGVRQHSHE